MGNLSTLFCISLNVAFLVVCFSLRRAPSRTWLPHNLGARTLARTWRPQNSSLFSLYIFIFRISPFSEVSQASRLYNIFCSAAFFLRGCCVPSKVRFTAKHLTMLGLFGVHLSTRRAE